VGRILHGENGARMLDCQHVTTLIQSSHGSGGEECVSVCRRCGEIQVTATKDGVHFSTHFHLANSYLLIAASQAYRLNNDREAKDVLGKTVSKPLDFGHLRLYQVRLHWCLKSGRQGTDSYVVAADSPNQTTHSAANQIRELYKESYDNNPDMSYWDVQGYALNVVQPLSWVESGITLLNLEFEETFVGGEFKCPQCHFWASMQKIDEQARPIGVADVGEIPKCPYDDTVMKPITWREATLEAGRLASRWMRRAKQLEEAWPSNHAIPIEEDPLV
jgi:hypothetical protein